MPRINVNDIETQVNSEPQHSYGRHAGDLSTDEELKKASKESLLAMFCAYPQNVHFAGQMDKEEIIILLRAHLVTNIPWILAAILAAFVPPVLIFFLNTVGFLGVVSAGLVMIVTLYWYVGIFTFAFLNVLYWYFNVGIVTNERVVDIDWNSLTNRDVSTAQISKIQDVRGDLTGVFAGVFDFGSVYVETAGSSQNIEFLRVPHAQLIVRKIEELMQKEETEFEPK